eukprot:706026_1
MPRKLGTYSCLSINVSVDWMAKRWIVCWFVCWVGTRFCRRFCLWTVCRFYCRCNRRKILAGNACCFFNRTARPLGHGIRKVLVDAPMSVPLDTIPFDMPGFLKGNTRCHLPSVFCRQFGRWFVVGSVCGSCVGSVFG